MKLIEEKTYQNIMKTKVWEFEKDGKTFHLESKSHLETPGLNKESKGINYTRNNIVNNIRILRQVDVEGNIHYVIEDVNNFDIDLEKYYVDFSSEELRLASEYLENNLQNILHLAGSLLKNVSSNE